MILQIIFVLLILYQIILHMQRILVYILIVHYQKIIKHYLVYYKNIVIQNKKHSFILCIILFSTWCNSWLCFITSYY
eukprot:UN04326